VGLIKLISRIGCVGLHGLTRARAAAGPSQGTRSYVFAPAPVNKKHLSACFSPEI